MKIAQSCIDTVITGKGTQFSQRYVDAIMEELLQEFAANGIA